VASREEGKVKKRYPKPLTLIMVFLSSMVFFYVTPPLILSISAVSSSLRMLGAFNARVHMAILALLGKEAFASSNLLHLASGPVVEYSPFCFGFLSITAFAILALSIKSISLKDRIRWITGVTIILSVVNQGRIITELLIASAWPLLLSSVDMLFYPLLPLITLFLWYRGLKSREGIFASGVSYAGG
jgi:hypothetical protein